MKATYSAFRCAHTLLLLSGLLAAPAAQAVLLVVDGNAAAPGSTVTADINLSGGSGESGISTTLSYDTGALTLVSATVPGALPGAATAGCNGSGPGQVGFSANSGASDAPLQNGTYCTLTFQILPATAGGPYNISPSGTTCTTFSPSPTCDALAGTVVVQAPEYLATPDPVGTLTINALPNMTATASFDVDNVGTADLTVSPQPLAAPFSVNPSTSFTMASDAPTRAVSVACTAADAGTYNSTLVVNTNDFDEGTNSYPVQCIVAGPEADPTPAPGSTIDITANVGSSGTGTIALHNAGTQPLVATASGSALAPPLAIGPSGPTSIAAGATQDFTATCTPSAAGTFTQTVTIGSNDASEPTLTYTLRCTATAAEIDTTPPPGSLTLDTAPGVSTSTTISVSNSGNGPMTVDAGGLEMPLSVSPTAPVTIVAGGNPQTFTVSCLSATPGTFTQTLDVNSNDSDEATLRFPVTCNVVSAGVRQIVLVSGDGQSADPGTQFGEPLVVRLIDPNAAPGGTTLPPVSFSVISGDVRFTFSDQGGLSVTPAADGTAGAPLDAGTNPGPFRVEASAPGFGSVAFEGSVRDPTPPPPPTRVLSKVSGDQRAVANSAGQPLVARLTQDNRPQAGEIISFATLSGSGITLSASSATTDANGEARVSVSFGAQPTAAGIEAREARGATVVFDIAAPSTTDPPPPDPTTLQILIAGGDNQAGAINTLATAPIEFDVRGNAGAPAGNVELTFAVLEGSATPDATRAVTDSNGRASVRLRYGATPGAVRLQASALSGAVRAFAFATVFKPALAIVAGDAQQGAPGTRLSQPLVVGLSAAQAPAGSLAGYTVNWSVLSGGGSVSAGSSSTGPDGRAAIDFTLGANPGAQQVQAVIADIGTVVFNATATAPAASTTFEITAGNGQDIATGVPSAPLVVRIRSGQTPLAGGRVRWSVAPAGVATLSSSETVTSAGGETSITATANLPGTVTITARALDVSGSPAVDFALNGGVENTSGANPEQQEVGRAIDSACPALFARQGAGQSLTPEQQDLLARCLELVATAGANPQPVVAALEQLAADEALAQNNAALSVQSLQFDNVKARLAALRSGARGVSFEGLAVQTGDGSLPLSFLPSAVLSDEDAAGDGAEAGAQFSRWGFFATGSIGRGERDNDERDPGFEFDTVGLTAGVDYRYNDQLVFGLALGYNRNDTDVSGDRGRLESRGTTVAAYGTWYQGDAWYADGVVTLGRNDFDLTRRIRYQIAALNGGVTTVDQSASASPEGDQLAFALSVGRDFNRKALSFGPYARIDYTRVDFDGYVERLSNPGGPGSGLALAVDGRELKSLEGVLGGKLAYTLSTSWGVLMPYAQLEWLREFEDEPETFVTRFVNDPTGTAIAIDGSRIDTDYFNLGLGMSGVFASGRSAFVYYERRAGQESFSSDNIAVGIRIEF